MSHKIAIPIAILVALLGGMEIMSRTIALLFVILVVLLYVWKIRSRTTAILLAILVVQLGVWGLLSTDPHRVTEKENFITSDTGDVDYIHIKNKDGEITLKRVGEQWRISEPYNYPANPSYTATLLKKLSDLKYESLITTKKDKYEDYEVGGEEAAYVEIGKEGGTIDKFYCGKPSKNYSHTYMRLEDSKEVWLVCGTPRSSFTRKPKDWRDKKILKLDKTMIERVLLKFSDETVELMRNISSPMNDTTLVKADTSWTIIPKRGKPFKPADKVMNRVKNTLGRMNATDFLVAGIDSIPSFAKPDLIVEAFLEGNQKEIIEFIPQPDVDSKWLVRKNNDEKTIYVVYKSSYNNLAKRAKDFKEEDEG
ncbi:MAG: DUF4340 domain-containing protein [Candidatus Hatepunaea meridiana]|nr:DUF4340 domain-containing protein [Candidatus Hatepunaea meridiana]